MKPELQHGRHVRMVMEHAREVWDLACGQGCHIRGALGAVLDELSTAGAAGVRAHELTRKDRPMRRAALVILEDAGSVEATEDGRVRLVAQMLERLQLDSVRATVPAAGVQ